MPEKTAVTASEVSSHGWPVADAFLYNVTICLCDQLTVVISISHMWNLLRTEDVHLHTPALRIGTHFLLTLETAVFLFHLLSTTLKPFSSLSTRTAHAARFFYKNVLYKFTVTYYRSFQALLSCSRVHCLVWSHHIWWWLHVFILVTLSEASTAGDRTDFHTHSLKDRGNCLLKSFVSGFCHRCRVLRLGMWNSNYFVTDLWISITDY